MTLQTIANAFALNVGVQKTEQIVSSADRTWQEMLSMSNLVGDELARRADWGDLTTAQTLTGDGTNKVHDLGTAFSRVTPGIGVQVGSTPVRPLTRAEWASLTASEGTPRYFLLEDTGLTLWPYLADGSTATLTGQTKNWCSSGGNVWAADTDTSLIDESLMLLGLIVRWRRQKGMDFADYEAEYEAALSDLAGFDDRSRL